MTAPTFKKATDTDAGTSAQYGAPDLKYALDVLDGSHATDRVQVANIEGAVTTDTTQTITGLKTFGQNAIRIQNPAATFFYIIQSNPITANRTLNLPVTTVADTFVVEGLAQTLTNKTLTTPTIAEILNAGGNILLTAGGTTSIQARSTHGLTKGFSGTADPTTTDVPNGYFTIARNTQTDKTKIFYNDNGILLNLNNTDSGVLPAPEGGRKFGGYFGGANAATSLTGFTVGTALLAVTGTQVITHQNSATDKKNTRFATGGTSGNTAGQATGTDTAGAVMRAYNVKFACKFRINQADTAHRIFIGLKSATTALTGDTPLANNSGIILHKTAAGTSWTVMSNDGTGAAATTTPSGTYNTNIHTIEFRTTAGDAGMEYSFDGSAFASVSEPPASGTVLYPTVWIETSAAAAKSMDIWWWYMAIDS